MSVRPAWATKQDPASWAEDMAPWVKAFPAKPDDLSSIPRAHTTEEIHFHKLSSNSRHIIFNVIIIIKKTLSPKNIKRSWGVLSFR